MRRIAAAGASSDTSKCFETISGARELPTTLPKPPLTLSYSETAQPFDILRRVIAPSRLIATSQRERAEAFTEAEPRGGYAEFSGRFANSECPTLSEHADILKVVS